MKPANTLSRPGARSWPPMGCACGKDRRTGDEREVANLPRETVATQLILLDFGGRGGIRTHGTLAGTPVFKTGALNHSATLPSLEHQSLSATKIKNSLATRPNLDPHLD